MDRVSKASRNPLAIVAAAVVIGVAVGAFQYATESYVAGFTVAAHLEDVTFGGCPDPYIFFAPRGCRLFWSAPGETPSAILVTPMPKQEVPATFIPATLRRLPDLRDLELAGVVAVVSYFLLVAFVLSIRAIRGSSSSPPP